MIEFQFSQGPVNSALLLRQLCLAVVGMSGAPGRDAAALEDGPENEGQGRQGQHGDRDDLRRAHDSRSAISRRMRSRVSGSTGVIGAALAARRLQRRIRRMSATSPTKIPANGAVQTRRLNPRGRGERRIYSPYLSMK